MDYNTPLLQGQFLKRYKRFFADVELAGKKIVAHVPNTGSLRGICEELRPCLVLPNDNPERKLKFTLEQVQTADSWVGVNTHRANDLVWEAFQKKKLSHWQSFIDGSREIKITPQTRLDFKFTMPHGAAHFVEVKSVSMCENSVALFPDAETTRGQKHLLELIKLTAAGMSCEIFFVIQRSDCRSFSPAQAIDKEYARLLRAAAKAGVRITAYQTTMSNRGIEITTQEIPIKLD